VCVKKLLSNVPSSLNYYFRVSFLRRQESKRVKYLIIRLLWIPAFAGTTWFYNNSKNLRCLTPLRSLTYVSMLPHVYPPTSKQER
jgi:hypothetical protein